METASGIRSLACQYSGIQFSKRRQRKAFRTDKPNRYAFLNESISEIACSKFNTMSLGLGNIDWGRNLPYLEASAKKWCELHGEEYTVETVDEFPLERVSRIYQFLLSKTHEEGFDVDYIPEEKMIKFLEYQECDFPDHKVFYIPVVYLDKFTGKMREILMAFASWILHNTIYLLPSHCFDFEMILESYEFEPDDEDDEEVAERKKIVEFYRRGKGMELFNEIYDLNVRNGSTIHNLIAKLETKERDKNKDIIALIKQGLKIMSEDDLRDHTYFPGFCTDHRFACLETETHGSEWVVPDRLFVFTYGNADDDEGEYDEIAACALHNLSEEANNCGILTFRDAKHIAPEDTEPFVASEKPMEWAKWFNEFLIRLTNEQTEYEVV